MTLTEDAVGAAGQGSFLHLTDARTAARRGGNFSVPSPPWSSREDRSLLGDSDPSLCPRASQPCPCGGSSTPDQASPHHRPGPLGLFSSSPGDSAVHPGWRSPVGLASVLLSNRLSGMRADQWGGHVLDCSGWQSPGGRTEELTALRAGPGQRPDLFSWPLKARTGSSSAFLT